MSLRTYQLITHPAFLRHIEASKLQLPLFPEALAADVPIHRPDIQNLADIAKYLGVSPLTIRGLIIAKFKHYRTFTFRKRSGGTRQISAPRTYLKVVQWWINDTILSSAEASPHAFGFVKNRSYVDNAKFHFGAKNILNVDLKDFFPSISSTHVEDIFSSFGYRPTIARCLTELTTLDGTLPQGAPTSPPLANLRMLEIDGELNEIAVRHGVRFSRYADDLTFSGNHKISAEIIDEIKSTVSKYGFTLNDKKTRFMGINQRKEVTGIVLGEDGICLPPEFLNSARGWFHFIAHNPEKFIEKFDAVRGTVAHISHVGGRGSESAVRLGTSALNAIRPLLETQRQVDKTQHQETKS